MKRYGIRDEGVGMDFACKTVSACFALLAASMGAIILFTPSTSKKPDNTTYSSQEGYDNSKSLLHQIVLHFMLFATAYFLYDMYAMYEVRLGYTQHLKTTKIVLFLTKLLMFPGEPPRSRSPVRPKASFQS